MAVLVYPGRELDVAQLKVSVFPQELETLDNGKPYAISYSVDLPNVVKCLR